MRAYDKLGSDGLILIRRGMGFFVAEGSQARTLEAQRHEFIRVELHTMFARMDELAAKRREKQPLEWPSGGSTFKRPEGHFAAALIEGCGLKGVGIGGAQVSEKHAGFVVNRGGATADDVRRLMALVQETVLRETGVALEPEVRLLGF